MSEPGDVDAFAARLRDDGVAVFEFWFAVEDLARWMRGFDSDIARWALLAVGDPVVYERLAALTLPAGEAERTPHASKRSRRGHSR